MWYLPKKDSGTGQRTVSIATQAPLFMLSNLAMTEEAFPLQTPASLKV